MELFDLLLLCSGICESMFTGMKREILNRIVLFRAMRTKHFQVVGCVGVLSNQCAVQQIFAIACLKQGIQSFNDYSTTSSTGFLLLFIILIDFLGEWGACFFFFTLKKII
jgi:hypothetical protein